MIVKYRASTENKLVGHGQEHLHCLAVGKKYVASKKQAWNKAKNQEDNEEARREEFVNA